MKSVKTILIILLTTATLSPATEDYIFATREDTMYICDLEGNYRGEVQLPSDTEALTFDGDYWWMVYNETEIYCFDKDGNYVSSFPVPHSNVRGLTFDGDCLWIGCEAGDYVYVYERTPEGNVGPHGDFVIDKEATFTFAWSYEGFGYDPSPGILIGLFSESSGVILAFYDRDGLFYGYGECNYWFGWVHSGTAISNYYEFYNYVVCDPPDGSISVWVMRFAGTEMHEEILLHDSDGPLEKPCNGLELGAYEYIGLVKESFGKIKAYFEGGN